MKKLMIILLLGFCYSCKKDKDVRVRYDVMTQPFGFQIIYIDQGGLTITDTIHQSFWSYEFMSKKGRQVSIKVQSLDSNAKVATRIYKNGSIEEQQINSGDYVISQVSSTLE